MTRYLVTGGGGFVWPRSVLEIVHREPSTQVLVFDNLRRLWQEANLVVLPDAGIAITQGIPDDANLDDLDATESMVPKSWTAGSHGTLTFRVIGMGSRYAFVILHFILEHLLSRGEYRCVPRASPTQMAG